MLDTKLKSKPINKPYTRNEENNIQKLFDELYEFIEKEKLIQDKDELRLLVSIYNLSKEAHKQGKNKYGAPEYQRRKTGEKAPYFSHPIEVAKICAIEMGLRFISISAALIHDVLEDTYYSESSKEEIIKLISTSESDYIKLHKILTVVDGVTKLLEKPDSIQSGRSKQVANFKHWIKHAHNPQTLMVKIADRLHNMRTMEHMVENKKLEKAAETTYLYIPIARKLGLSKIIKELENYSFKYRFPSRYEELQNHFKNCEKDRDDFKAQLKTNLQPLCDAENLKVDIMIIKKSVYSIYLKMEDKKSFYFSNLDKFLPSISMYKINFIITSDNGKTPTVMSCWKFYAILSTGYTHKTSKLKDWISVPNGLGYQSLHVPIMGKENTNWRGQWIDTRIRTKEMHRTSQMGFNAIKSENNSKEQIKRGAVLFLEQLFGNNLNNGMSSRELPAARYLDSLNDDEFDAFRNSINAYEITIYDETGNSFVVNAKSTVLDVAFRNGDCGFKCIGATVNGIAVKLGHQLMNEDQITLYYSDTIQKNYNKMLANVMTLNAKSLIYNAIEKEIGNKKNYEVATCCNPIKGDNIFVHCINAKKARIHKTTCIKALCHDAKEIRYVTNDKKINNNAISVDEIWKGKNKFVINLKVEGMNRRGLLSDIAKVLSQHEVISFKVRELGTNKYHFAGNFKFHVQDLPQLKNIIGQIDNIENVEKCYKVEK